jgi:hypothetical protein
MRDLVGLTNNTVDEHLFDKLTIERPTPYIVRDADWQFRAKSLPKIPRDKLHYEWIGKDKDAQLIMELHKSLVLVSLNGTNCHVRVVAGSQTAATRVINSIKEAVPINVEPDEGDIAVRFWWRAPNGPKSVVREIAAPEWDAIDINYEKATKNALRRLYTGFKPSHGGQIILWHGMPGTGKTYALRALCQQWKEWCSVHYIVDPEVFLTDVSYLTGLALGDENRWDYLEDDDEQKWKLLIMEDTGELIREDAQDISGQRLSRLLNVTDGFIGQGLKILVLITTNEQIDKLHPAVSRPGRCAAAIGFNPLTFVESERWAEAHGISLTNEKDYPVSELYGIKEDYAKPSELKKRKGSLGFDLKEVTRVAV